MKWVEVNILDGEETLVIAIQFSTSPGLADISPVSGTITGAGKAFLFHEGLKQDRGIAISSCPIVWQLFGDACQDAGSEIRRGDPGEDEESGVINNEMEVLLALCGCPADEAVSGGCLPCGGAEAQCSQEAISATYQVAYLGAWQGFVSEVVVAGDQLVPEFRIF